MAVFLLQSTALARDERVSHGIATQCALQPLPWRTTQVSSEDEGKLGPILVWVYTSSLVPNSALENLSYGVP